MKQRVSVSEKLKQKGRAMDQTGGAINAICAFYDQLSTSEKLVADFVLANRCEAARLTTRQIADASDVSAATVSRFARHVGYSSFLELCRSLADDEGRASGMAGTNGAVAAPGALAAAWAGTPFSIDAPHAVVAALLEARNRELADTAKILDEGELARAARMIERSDYVVFGADDALYPAALSAAGLFSQLGLRAHCSLTAEGMLHEARTLTSRDALVLISKQGRSERLNKMMEVAHTSGASSIVIATVPNSALVRHASCALCAVTREKTLSKLPFSHASIDLIIEAIFLMLASDAPSEQPND